MSSAILTMQKCPNARIPFYEDFLRRKAGQTKKCNRCGEMKLIADNFTLKLKQYYRSPDGEKRMRRTPAVECSPNCHPCESIRTLEGRRILIAASPEYRQKYLQKFESFAALREANPEMQREVSRRWAQRNRKKANAHAAANKAHPVRQQCSIADCAELGERHHPDYDKPTDIVWLCRKHHKARHWEEKYGNL